MDNATSLITQFNLSKEQVQKFAARVTDEVQSGDYNPLQVLVCLKSMEEAVKQIKENIALDVEFEAEKYAEKTIILNGAKIEKKQRTSYDYSQDQTWNDLKNKVQEREKMLKSLPHEMADPETGEVVFPAIQKVTTYTAVTLP